MSQHSVYRDMKRFCDKGERRKKGTPAVSCFSFLKQLFNSNSQPAFDNSKAQEQGHRPLFD